MYTNCDPLPIPDTYKYQQSPSLTKGFADCRPVEQLDNKKIISLLTEIRDLLKSLQKE